MVRSHCVAAIALVAPLIASPPAPGRSPHPGGDDPYADEVVAYDAGSGANPDYTDAATSLGPPERFTGEGVFPGVVSVFNPPFGTDELVTIGEGGSLTVRFATPVTDDPGNLYGIDLLIFGNAGFIDSDWPNGNTGPSAALFSEPGAVVEVSPDGSDGSWVMVPGVTVDDLFPPQGYLDLADPYAAAPGAVESDFTRPVDPLLTLGHFDAHTFPGILALYRGSGGGTGIDLASVGLASITHVRITNPMGSQVQPEIDAFADAAPRRLGDATLDGVVNIDDFLAVLGGWGPLLPGDPPADFDNDRDVDIDDFLAVLGSWD